jgi:hypothetical protein
MGVTIPVDLACIAPEELMLRTQPPADSTIEALVCQATNQVLAMGGCPVMMCSIAPTPCEFPGPLGCIVAAGWLGGDIDVEGVGISAVWSLSSAEAGYVEDALGVGDSVPTWCRLSGSATYGLITAGLPTVVSLPADAEVHGYAEDVRWQSGRGLSVDTLQRCIDALVTAAGRPRILAIIGAEEGIARPDVGGICAAFPFTSRGRAIGMSVAAIENNAVSSSVRLSVGQVTTSCSGWGTGPTVDIVRADPTDPLPVGELLGWIDVLTDGSTSDLDIYSIIVYEYPE